MPARAWKQNVMTAAPNNVEKKANGMGVTKRPPRGRFRRLVIPLLILAAVSLGVGSGLFVSRILDVPSIYELEDYTPSLTTTVLSADGVTLARFASEKRINIDAANIPQVVKDAVVAAED